MRVPWPRRSAQVRRANTIVAGTALRRRHLGTWETASAWMATHPDVATLSAVSAAVSIPVAVFAYRRIWRLQQDITVTSTQQERSEQELSALRVSATAEQHRAAESEKQLRSSLTAAETSAHESAKREREAAEAAANVQAQLQAALGRESRLQSSISHRGQLGERALEQLLELG